jgi:hypothetical protein
MSGANSKFSGVVMSQSQTSDVIRSLETVRERVKQRLTKVPEYRAFLAIETPMAEVAHIPELHAHLETAKQKILERLALTREYQALLTVEKAIKEISEVLDVVGDDGNVGTAPAEIAAPPPRVGLAALVHESFAAQLGNEGIRSADQGAEPERAKVA